MLRILGSSKRTCDGITRRDLLRAGPLSLLTGGAHTPPAAGTPSGGKAKNVILLYLFGGPSQLDTFDPKPDAPAEVRGDVKSIRTTVPGIDICEHLPRVATVMDRVTLIRSLNHPWNFHGMQYATTGLPQGTIPIEETQLHPEQWPFIGSVVSFLDHQRSGAKPRGRVPDNVVLPWLLSSKRTMPPYGRLHAAYLGGEFDPIWGEFRGDALRAVTRTAWGPAEEVRDPHLGITPGSRFELAAGTALDDAMTLDRLGTRRSLLDQFDAARRDADASRTGRRLDENRARAFALMDSAAVRTALDLDREPEKVRSRYGLTLFGQGVLQARRLVEAGCRFVTVIWDEFGQLNTGWDTHVDQRNRLRNELLPGFDHAFSALVDDLTVRGLLDDTLVLVLSEMGRTPRLDGDGRGHWGRAYCNLLAGGGSARGRVIGRTDRIASTPVDRPVRAKDVLATAYHLLGIDHEATVADRLGRPVPLLPYGDVIREAVT
ncbi:DUF1501 domain-containing protein [Urbifossiella limnaea]|uniref:DUF1501 domain-containing protein n=1 Tax=Urbifossiella limnaea TaxID=2528023 RepID=A0A517XV24_9BACT|nr:DUF1501 domain-containing protein [Urbifossiella limnaea]QDU21329.1 hypothetical protein ETAA1_32950 [Urbifossiella limnaea]